MAGVGGGEGFVECFAKAGPEGGVFDFGAGGELVLEFFGEGFEEFGGLWVGGLREGDFGELVDLDGAHGGWICGGDGIEDVGEDVFVASAIVRGAGDEFFQGGDEVFLEGFEVLLGQGDW